MKKINPLLLIICASTLFMMGCKNDTKEDKSSPFDMEEALKE